MINVVMKEHFKIMEVTKPNYFFAFCFFNWSRVLVSCHKLLKMLTCC